jgi:hypothetical protein
VFPIRWLPERKYATFQYKVAILCDFYHF